MLSRRSMLRRTGIAGLAAAGLGGIGCGKVEQPETPKEKDNSGPQNRIVQDDRLVVVHAVAHAGDSNSPIVLFCAGATYPVFE